MKHCGKTADGRALATRWRCPFYDVDQMIEEYNERETGQRMTVREIFAKGGEDRFRELEAKAVCDLFLRLGETEHSNVVAVGGRTALNKKVDALLRAMGLVVYLEISPDEILARIARSGLPPFVDENDPENHLIELYNERTPHYQKLSHLTVNVNGLDPASAAEELNRAIEEYSRGQRRAS